MTYIDVTICDARETALLAAAVRLVNEANHSLTNRGHGRFRYSVLPSGGPEHLLPELPELVPLELHWGQSIGADASQAGREIDMPVHDGDGQYLADVRVSFANAAVLGVMLTDAADQAARDPGTTTWKFDAAAPGALIARLTGLVDDLYEVGDCTSDHRGDCQHGWSMADAVCPHARAKDLLRELGVPVAGDGPDTAAKATDAARKAARWPTNPKAPAARPRSTTASSVSTPTDPT